MKNSNKLILTISSCAICLFFAFCSTAFAAEMVSSQALSSIQKDPFLHWTEFPIKEDVAIDKVWTITFTQPINKASLNNGSIYIKDGEFNSIDISFQLSEDGKIVKIVPASNYSPGHAYYLYVTNKVLSSSGSSLSKPTCITFTVKANAKKIDETNNKENMELKIGDILELTLPECTDGGYAWKFKSALDTTILKVIDETVILPSCDPTILGGTRQKRWLFQAVGTGDASIDLEEARSWDANSTISTFTLKTTVKAH